MVNPARTPAELASNRFFLNWGAYVQRPAVIDPATGRAYLAGFKP